MSKCGTLIIDLLELDKLLMSVPDLLRDEVFIEAPLLSTGLFLKFAIMSMRL